MVDVRKPTHMTCSAFWADLTATLDAYDIADLLDDSLAKPMLGHPMFAAGRRRCEMRWLRSRLAVLEASDLAA